jgi:hypothetical protein
MKPDQEPDEKPERMRLLCSKCKRWVEANSVGPRYLFMDGCGVLPPPSPEAIKARAVSATFMQRHMVGCRSFVAAIYESDPDWAALDEINREDENNAV